uniref:Cysteine rich secreted protein n=1 Tax=Riptortus pedestris TaxID=329032 RepID=R4WD45_RIPPE|nr:cysteine rich secreted protein [Riptortus pedestris]
MSRFLTFLVVLSVICYIQALPPQFGNCGAVNCRSDEHCCLPGKCCPITHYCCLGDLCCSGV